MIWIILALIICVLVFGWWGLLIFAVLVGVFYLILVNSKPIKPLESSIGSHPTINQTEQSLAKCPKCGSSQLTANKKGFSIGQAVAGGIIGGSIGMNKIKITCLKCGNVFNPGQGN
jgi:ribosomal protein S27AE